MTKHTHSAHGMLLQVESVIIAEFWQDARIVTGHAWAMAMSLSQHKSLNSHQIVRIEIEDEVIAEHQTVRQ